MIKLKNCDLWSKPVSSKSLAYSVPSSIKSVISESARVNKTLKPPSFPTQFILDRVRRRILALKKLQIQTASLEAKFCEEVHLLECKYNRYLKPLGEMRRLIVNGEYDPTDEDCLKEIDEKGDTAVDRQSSQVDSFCKETLLSSSSSIKFMRGLPGFWLRVLKSVNVVSRLIEPHDEPALQHLCDLELDLSSKKPYGFALKFHFTPNDFFSDSTLTKTYELGIELSKSGPYVFEAPVAQRSLGCEIHWNKGKNVVLDESKSHLKLRPSFFNFFQSSKTVKSGERVSLDDELDMLIDYEAGCTIKEKVIPHAVLYYLGELVDDDDDFELNDYDNEQD